MIDTLRQSPINILNPRNVYDIALNEIAAKLYATTVEHGNSINELKLKLQERENGANINRITHEHESNLLQNTSINHIELFFCNIYSDLGWISSAKKASNQNKMPLDILDISYMHFRSISTTLSFSSLRFLHEIVFSTVIVFDSIIWQSTDLRLYWIHCVVISRILTERHIR